MQECFGDSGGWIPYIRPGFTLSKQVGEAARGNPDLKLVVLAKHGLVVWGDTAEEAYRRTIEVINQAVAFVNERTGDAPRFGGAHPAADKVADDARAELLHELLPAVRGAVSSERPKLLTLDASARAVEFVSSAEAEQLVTVGAPCPDHLVHTKRLPLWIAYDPDTDDADALRERIAERAEAFRADYREYVDAHGDDSTEPADPDPRIVLIQHLGLISTGTTTKNSTVSRDLYHRAIEVMAGAQALDEFVSLDAEESFAIEYWPLELYKLAQAPPPGELQGQVALVTGGAGGIGRAIGDSLADAGACVVAFDLDQDGAEDAVAAFGDSGLAVSGDVTSEDAVAVAFAAAVESASAASTSSSPTPASRRARRSRRPRWPSGSATTASSAPATSSSRARRSASCASRASAAARSSSSPRRTRSSPARTPRRTRRRRRPSCTSRAASPRRAARRHPRQHRQPRRRAAGLAHLGLVDGARSARPPTASSPTSSRSTTASAPRWRSTSSPRTSPRRCCTSPRRRARARAPATCSTSTGACPRPTPADGSRRRR